MTAEGTRPEQGAGAERLTEGGLTNSSYLRFDGMTWPNPVDPNGVQWRLRYGTPSKSDLLVAASFMHAYSHLIELPRREREQRISALRAAATEEGR